MRAALTAVVFVLVALVVSGARIDTSVLIWSAVGIFGLVFGLTVVGRAHRKEAPAQARAFPVPAAREQPDAEPSPSLAVAAAAFVEESQPARTPKHAAELVL